MTSQRTRPPNRQDSGETTTQLVIVLPVLIFILILGVQLAVHAHTAHVATAAAAHGAAVGSTASAGATSAATAARRLVEDLGAVLASSPSVRAGAGDVTVTVALVVPRLVPLLPRTVTRQVSEPKERLTREWER